MKNKIILPLIAILFLTSCANKFSLTKRKYTKGYYFASSGNKNSAKSENESKTVAVKALPAKKTTLPPTKANEAEIIRSEVVTFYKPETLKEKQTATQKPSSQKITASASAKQHITVKPNIKPVNKKQPINNTSQKGSDADVNLVIMIILCLFPFINLIPVYIHDGKKLTLNFLITLLLDFTWILGVVYALLVVLDVIDLA